MNVALVDVVERLHNSELAYLGPRISDSYMRLEFRHTRVRELTPRCMVIPVLFKKVQRMVGSSC